MGKKLAQSRERQAAGVHTPAALRSARIRGIYRVTMWRCGGVVPYIWPANLSPTPETCASS